MGKALYRKYRSKTLDEIVGQGHITDVLKRSIAQGKVAHAYLLTGPRGVGKTSIARILAHEINQLPYDDESNHLDIIEIDAASNNGVDDVRDLREKVQLAPVSASRKIYIIDEVHMLSKQAFNALLKTLEEPPAHVVFILATTDADKLPATIISRTQRFGFRAIAPRDAKEHLKKIAKEEKIKIDDAALELIAKRGDGSFRDSISLLDQLASLADEKTGITSELVERSLGLAPHTLVEKLLAAYEAKDLNELIAILDESDASGIQASVLSSQLIDTVRSELVAKPQLTPLLDELLDVAKSSQPQIKLLTVLAAHAIPKSKTAPLSVSTPVIDIPIKELEIEATKEKPSEPVIVKAEVPKAKKTAAPKPQTGKDIVLNWDELIEYTKKNYVAVYSVLSKCSYEIEGNTLHLYTANKFYKKKLDDAKYRILLIKSLEAVGVVDAIIDMIPTASPPKDETAAAVAAIMGGGEEVSVEE